jgi:hypothetical protein
MRQPSNQTEDFMDISIAVTIAFTVIPTLGIVALFAMNRKKK